MTDNEMIIYLHDLAREFNVEKIREIADRFTELSEKEKRVNDGWAEKQDLWTGHL